MVLICDLDINLECTLFLFNSILKGPKKHLLLKSKQHWQTDIQKLIFKF